MSAIVSISTLDGASPTPNAITLYPVSTSKGAASWRERKANVALTGQATADATLSKDKATGLNTVRLTITQPVLEEIASGNSLGYIAAPKVAYLMKARVEFFINDRTTEQNRKDIRSMLYNALDDSQIQNMVDQLELPY